MEHRTIRIQTALGTDVLEAILIPTDGGWTANLLPRPGYTMGGSASAPTQDEALAKLTELAQQQYEEQVRLEVERFGPHPQPSGATEPEPV
jgi:hypothetical protein